MIGPKISFTLERYTSSQDSGGGLIKIWASSKIIKGVFTSASGREFFSSNKKKVDSSHLFFCNYFTDSVSEKDRMKYGARIFDITYIDNPGELNTFYLFYLKERT